MNDLVVQGLVAAVVSGALQGYWRAVEGKKHAAAAAEAAARTQRLGSNLGPRVDAINERLARVEGRLGLEAHAGAGGAQQLADAGETTPIGPPTG